MTSAILEEQISIVTSGDVLNNRTGGTGAGCQQPTTDAGPFGPTLSRLSPDAYHLFKFPDRVNAVSNPTVAL